VGGCHGDVDDVMGCLGNDKQDQIEALALI